MNWDSHNIGDCSLLSYGDTVVFKINGRILASTVSSEGNYLNFGPDNAVVFKELGMTYEEAVSFCADHYTYTPISYGSYTSFPEARDGDLNALTRVVRALYRYIGHSIQDIKEEKIIAPFINDGKERCVLCYGVLQGSRNYGWFMLISAQKICCRCNDKADICTICNSMVRGGRFYGVDNTLGAKTCTTCHDARKDGSLHNHSYAPSKLRRYATNYCNTKNIPQLYAGIEIEIEMGREGDIDEIMAIASSKEWYFKHDGSLDSGFELVTYPMTFEYIRENRDKEIVSCDSQNLSLMVRKGLQEGCEEKG